MGNILVVEDEDMLRRIITMHLARRGYSVAEAESVASADSMLLAAATAHVPFDLIVLDVNLPDKTGWDILRRIVAQGYMAMPQVIVISATRPANIRLQEFQPAGVLIKPFPLEALSQLIQRVLAEEPVAVASGEAEGSTQFEDEGGSSALFG